MLELAKRVHGRILQDSTSEVYGNPEIHPQPEGYWGHVSGWFPTLLIQAPCNEDITIYGTGSQTRSFCYVDDLVEGMVRMMDSRDDFTGPVNLGNPGEFTILELAKKVIALTGSHSKLIHMLLPSDAPTQRRPIINLGAVHISKVMV